MNWGAYGNMVSSEEGEKVCEKIWDGRPLLIAFFHCPKASGTAMCDLNRKGM